jgi:glyoxylase-like metal-dependent hydrolase (beta-lactamase superfamily II)
VSTFDFGDELPGGIVAYEVGVICPDETALHIPSHRALAVADGIVRRGGAPELTFVPDSLMDDPDETKQGLREAYRVLLDLDLQIELLLLAHGAPVIADARRRLTEFVKG